MISTRYHFLVITVFAVIMLAAALYFQHVQGLEPCPLCIFQRIAVMGFGLISLLAFLHNPSRIGRKIYSALAAFAALSGATIAGRHVWLQHLPKDQVPACGPGLDFWLETLPITSVIQKVFQGSGECAEIDWQFLGFSMPEVTLPLFALIFLYATGLFFKKD